MHFAAFNLASVAPPPPSMPDDETLDLMKKSIPPYLFEPEMIGRLQPFFTMADSHRALPSIIACINDTQAQMAQLLGYLASVEEEHAVRHEMAQKHVTDAEAQNADHASARYHLQLELVEMKATAAKEREAARFATGKAKEEAERQLQAVRREADQKQQEIKRDTEQELQSASEEAERALQEAKAAVKQEMERGKKAKEDAIAERDRFHRDRSTALYSHLAKARKEFETTTGTLSAQLSDANDRIGSLGAELETSQSALTTEREASAATSAALEQAKDTHPKPHLANQGQGSYLVHLLLRYGRPRSEFR